MKKMLIVTPFIPGNQTAGQHYTLNLINDLARDVSIDICCFKYTKDAPYLPAVTGVRVAKTIIISAIRKMINCCKLPFLHPLFTCRFEFLIALFLFRRRNDYDCFYFDFSQTFIYSLFVPGTKKYLMFHDVIAQKYSRRRGWHNRVNYFLAKFTERIVLHLSGGTAVCFSDKDGRILRELYGVEAHQVDLYLGNDVQNLDYHQVEYTGRFAFFGAWSRPENLNGLIWFLDAVLPLLSDEIHFVIIGGGLSPVVQERIRQLPNITMTGFLDNPYPTLAGCAGLVAPLFQGAGVKVKVLEALACGTPVIGTGIALEGIELVEGAMLMHCEKAEDFAVSIKSMLKLDTTTKLRLRENFLSCYPKHLFREIFAHEI